MILIFVGIFAISLVWAFLSMGDMEIPEEIAKLLRVRKIKGTIVFFKDNKVKHYSSSSKSSE